MAHRKDEALGIHDASRHASVGSRHNILQKLKNGQFIKECCDPECQEQFVAVNDTRMLCETHWAKMCRMSDDAMWHYKVACRKEAYRRWKIRNAEFCDPTEERRIEKTEDVK